MSFSRYSSISSPLMRETIAEGRSSDERGSSTTVDHRGSSVSSLDRQGSFGGPNSLSRTGSLGGDAGGGGDSSSPTNLLSDRGDVVMGETTHNDVGGGGIQQQPQQQETEIEGERDRESREGRVSVSSMGMPLLSPVSEEAMGMEAGERGGGSSAAGLPDPLEQPPFSSAAPIPTLGFNAFTTESITASSILLPAIITSTAHTVKEGQGEGEDQGGGGEPTAADNGFIVPCNLFSPLASPSSLSLASSAASTSTQQQPDGEEGGGRQNNNRRTKMDSEIESDGNDDDGREGER